MQDLRLERRKRRSTMADPALANALQALTAVLQNLQYQPPASPAAAAPAARVNILDAFESTNPFDLGLRAG